MGCGSSSASASAPNRGGPAAAVPEGVSRAPVKRRQYDEEKDKNKSASEVVKERLKSRRMDMAHSIDSRASDDTDDAAFDEPAMP